MKPDRNEKGIWDIFLKEDFHFRCLSVSTVRSGVFHRSIVVKIIIAPCLRLFQAKKIFDISLALTCSVCCDLFNPSLKKECPIRKKKVDENIKIWYHINITIAWTITFRLNFQRAREFSTSFRLRGTRCHRLTAYATTDTVPQETNSPLCYNRYGATGNQQSSMLQQIRCHRKPTVYYATTEERLK